MGEDFSLNLIEVSPEIFPYAPLDDASGGSSDDNLPLQESLSRYEKKRLKRADKNEKKFHRLKERGKFFRAERRARKSFEIRKSVWGKFHSDVSSSAFYLGVALEKQEEYARAAVFYNKAIEIDQKILGKADSKIADHLFSLSIVQIQQEKYEEAKKSLLQALEIYEATHAEFPKISLVLTLLGVVFESLEDFEVALDYYQQMVEGDIEYYGKDHPEVGLAYDILAMFYYKQEKYELAISFYEKELELFRKRYVEVHEDISRPLFHLATCYEQMGDDEEAIRYYYEVLHMDEELFGEYDAEVAYDSLFLARSLERQQDYAEARKYFEKAFRIRFALLGKKHPDVYHTTLELAAVLEKMGELEEAAIMYAFAVRISKKAYGRRHTELVNSYKSLASVLLKQKKYDESMYYYVHALVIQEKQFGPFSLEAGDIIEDLASINLELGRYSKSEFLYERYLKIQRDELGVGHPRVAVTLNNLAGIAYYMGDYGQARILINQALDIQRSSPETSGQELATSLNTSAMIFQEEGAYSQAKLDLEKALDIWRQEKDTHPISYAMGLNSLGSVLYQQGDYESAIEVFRESTEIFEGNFQTDQSGYATALHNLAMCSYEIGDYGEASSNFSKSLAVWRDLYGEGHVSVAEALASLALVYTESGDYDQANTLFEQVYEIQVSVFGEYHYRVALTLYNLAAVNFELQNYNRAMDLYTRAQSILENTLMADHPFFPSFLMNFALLYVALGRRQEAALLLEEAMEKISKYFDSLFDITSERQKLALVKSLRRIFFLYLDVCGMDEIGSVYANLLNWKGIVGQAQMAQQKFVFSSHEAQKAFDELAGTRRRIANLTFLEFDDSKGQQRQNEIFHLTKEKERLQQELSGQSAEFRREQTALYSNPQQIAESLPSGGVLVDFVKYQKYHPHVAEKKESFEIHYMAFVVYRGYPLQIKRVELGSADKIDQAISDYREGLNLGMDNSFWRQKIDEAGVAVRELIWDPLAQAVGDTETVFVVPDAAITGVSFAGLPTQDGRYLVEDKAFGYLEHARDIVRYADRSEEQQNTGALVVGDVQYSSDEEVGHFRGDPTRVAGCARDDWQRLVATAEEVEAVSAVLSSQQQEVLELSGAEATEQRVYENLSGHAYIHLATHGFFASGDQCASAHNPMVLSGIVLAGVNSNEGATSGDKDGILTAEEVAVIDLRGTEMVVLSACETGLGEVASGEGVLGLRRAFVQAGAETLVMSLWSVPDEGTSQLMQAMYGHLFDDTSEFSKLEALRKAQREQLQKNREQFGHGVPVGWAGFIPSGDWD